MTIDPNAADPAFPGGHMPAADLDELLEWARGQLGLNGVRPWRLISARKKFSKVLFEIEEQRKSGPLRLIGKVSPEHRSRVAFEALRCLRAAGFCPPSRYTVVEPVAWLPERHLVLLEKAPGVELVKKVECRDSKLTELIQDTAHWLFRLHTAAVPVEPWPEPQPLDMWRDDLAGLFPSRASHIRRLAAKAAERTGRDCGPLVPCHGDFHLMNMFVENGRLTAIDIDKFGGREAVEEVGYFLVQAASICFHRLGGFDASLELRELFLRSYEEVSGELCRERIGSYMAITLLKNLHFDLFSYRSGRNHILDSWLDAAEQCLEGDIHFS